MDTLERKYSAEDTDLKNFPQHLLKQVFDKNDSVLFGRNYTKGKVSYNYIPGEFTTTGNPLIISTSIKYDGEGNSTLPEGSLIMDFLDLPKMFPDNKFGN
jgi:hypothetical protein